MNVASRDRARTNWLQVVRYRVAAWIEVALLFVFSLIFISPLVWAFSTSFREPSESFSVPPEWIPRDLDFGNYAAVFGQVPFASYILNSTIVTTAIIIGQLFTAALAGYAFARLRFPGSTLLFGLVLATIMIPFQATVIPVFVLIRNFGLADTLPSLILPAWATAFGTFLLRQFFMQLPNEFEEAALLDGANQWQIFWSIYLRLAAPALAVLAILSFNLHWNEFFRPLIFLTSDEKFTLPLGLVTLQGYLGTGSISVVLAGVVMSLVPVLIVFLIGQRYLIEGITVGGVKG